MNNQESGRNRIRFQALGECHHLVEIIYILIVPTELGGRNRGRGQRRMRNHRSSSRVSRSSRKCAAHHICGIVWVGIWGGRHRSWCRRGCWRCKSRWYGYGYRKQDYEWVGSRTRSRSRSRSRSVSRTRGVCGCGCRCSSDASELNNHRKGAPMACITWAANPANVNW